jgi:hypothetical protein
VAEHNFSEDVEGSRFRFIAVLLLRVILLIATERNFKIFRPSRKTLPMLVAFY